MTILNILGVEEGSLLLFNPLLKIVYKPLVKCNNQQRPTFDHDKPQISSRQRHTACCSNRQNLEAQSCFIEFLAIRLHQYLS